MNYYIFLSQNFRTIDNKIFSEIINANSIIVIFIKLENNYLRKNTIVKEAWNILANELIEIGIDCYEFEGMNQELKELIDIIKKGDNNVILEDTPTLLFPLITKEYKLCKPFFTYQLKNNKVSTIDSESFFKEKYNLNKIDCQYSQLKLYKKKTELGYQSKIINHIWNQILNSNIILNYAEKRDFLEAEHTTNLSRYINSGQISVRQIWIETINLHGINNPGVLKFLSELAWRDFAYHQFQYHPNMFWENLNPSPTIIYKNNEKDFDNWKQSKTGFPIIDAGMNQLNKTGWIPNRIRMLVASYLTKNLSVSWQQGAEYFLEQLIDADPIINALNWQWVAGTGIDHMPYFRIFNPTLQAKKYDSDGIYQKKWII